MNDLKITAQFEDLGEVIVNFHPTPYWSNQTNQFIQAFSGLRVMAGQSESRALRELYETLFDYPEIEALMMEDYRTVRAEVIDEVVEILNDLGVDNTLPALKGEILSRLRKDGE